MKKKARLFFLLAAVGVTWMPPAWAQGNSAIRGQVFSQSSDGIPSNVLLILANSSSGQAIETRTDMEGRYQFDQLLPGNYSLLASHQDFGPEEVFLSLKPREVRILNITLGSRSEIQVIAKAVSLPSTYSPSSTVLDLGRIDSLPMGQRANLPEVVVTSAPGMIRGHDDFVHVRGQELALNTFINGVSFWENTHSLFSGGLSPEVISSANVMTGGFSAEYGNRFGGILDIVTKSGFSMNNEGSLSISAGNDLRHSTAVEYGGYTDRVGYYLFTSGFESARFLSPPDPRAIHDTGRGAHHFLQLDFNPNPSNTLKLVLMGDGANFEIPKSAQDDELRPGATATQQTRQQTAVLSWAHSLSADTRLTTSLYQRWSPSELHTAVDPLAAMAWSSRELWTAGIKSDLRKHSGRHTIQGGLDLVMLRPEELLVYDYSGYRTLAHLLELPHVHFISPVVFHDRRTGGQMSLYVQDAIQLSKITLDLGLRYDQYSLAVSAAHVSPRVNVSYRFGQAETLLHASYNHYFVPPPVENVLSSSSGITAYIQEIGALPALEPTTENQWEVGLIQPVWKGSSLGVTGYYRASDNPIHTAIWPDARVYAYASFDRARAYGLELKGEAPLVRELGISGYVNYALGRVYFYNPVTGGFISEAEHLAEENRFLAPMDQTHTLTGGLTYRHRTSGLWFSLNLEYGSGTPMGHGEAHDHGTEPAGMEEPAQEAHGSERVEGHFTQNLSLGVDLFRDSNERPGLGLQFNVENLTENVYKIAQESVFSPGQYYAPRQFSGTLKIFF